jgi:hypothetical protein
MPGLPLRARPGLSALALIVAFSASSGEFAAAQPAPSPSSPPASAQPAPPASAQPSSPTAPPPPAQPAPSAAPGAAPPAGQAWYPPQGYPPPEGYQPWPYYPQYGYGYESPYAAPPPPPKEPYNGKLMVAGVLMSIGGTLGLIVGSVVVATSKGRIDVYCDGPVRCAQLDDQIRKGVGIGLMIGGGVVAIPGIAFWIVGGRKVPVRKTEPAPKDAAPPSPAAFSAPVLRVGPTGASLTVQF